MSKLAKPTLFETTFETYTAAEQIGEGGAGRVYGGTAQDGTKVAVKVLTTSTTAKRARFKNEIGFLQKNPHPNIIAVLDHGLTSNGKGAMPFYVMPWYEGSLRTLMQKGIPPARVLSLFTQILDGVEAAHLKDVVHRDLKPENILYAGTALVVADFGIARFTEDALITQVQTAPTDRLANFMYAAPEQRVSGKQIGHAADIYALGLVLNEMFTGSVPHGTDYAKIGSVSASHSFLDPIVEQMLRQSPADRPPTIADLKRLLIKTGAEAVSLQKISAIDQTVIKAGEIEDPLAFEPPKLIDANWDGGLLTLTLDRPVSQRWVRALQSMGNFTAVVGKPPGVFNFSGSKAAIGAQEHEAQPIINYFKQWLPAATAALRHDLEREIQNKQAQERERLRQQRLAEEQRLRVNRSLRI